jgi:hypothetical protein
MEGMQNGLSRDGQTLEENSTHRLPRPESSSLFFNAGSMYGSQKFDNSRRNSPVKRSSTKHSAPSRGTASQQSPSSEDESDDELDLLSQTSSQKSRREVSLSPQKMIADVYMDNNGKKHAYDTNYMPNNVLKGLKFGKTSQSQRVDTAAKTPKENKTNINKKPDLSHHTLTPSPSSRPLRDKSRNHDTTPRPRPSSKSVQVAESRPMPRPIFNKVTESSSPRRPTTSYSTRDPSTTKQRGRKVATDASDTAAAGSPAAPSPKKLRNRKKAKQVIVSDADDEATDTGRGIESDDSEDREGAGREVKKKG